jgi:hypothetical protein
MLIAKYRTLIGKARLLNIFTTTKNPNQLTQVETQLIQKNHFHITEHNDVYLKLIHSSRKFRFNKSPYYRKDPHELKDVYLESGAVMSMPKWYKLGILKIIANIIAFICIGVLVSKSVVNFLDENDIFKPEEDDDDDDED